MDEKTKFQRSQAIPWHFPSKISGIRFYFQIKPYFSALKKWATREATLVRVFVYLYRWSDNYPIFFVFGKSIVAQQFKKPLLRQISWSSRKGNQKPVRTYMGRTSSGSVDFLFVTTTPKGMPTAKSRNLSKNRKDQTKRPVRGLLIECCSNQFLSGYLCPPVLIPGTRPALRPTL